MRTKISAYSALLHVALVTLAVLVVVLARENRRLKAPPALGPSLAVGQETGALELVTLAGTPLEVAASKDHLLLVFTTSCSACRANQPRWQNLYQRTQTSFDVIGVSLSPADATETYRRAHQLTFPLALPADRERFATQYQLSAVPSTIWLSADGRVRGSWQGALTESQEEEIAAQAAASPAPLAASSLPGEAVTRAIPLDPLSTRKESL